MEWIWLDLDPQSGYSTPQTLHWRIPWEYRVGDRERVQSKKKEERDKEESLVLNDTQKQRDVQVEIGTFWSTDAGRLNNKANSTVGVRNSHATLCDPVSFPELLYWKHCGMASTEEAVGFSEPQG